MKSFHAVRATFLAFFSTLVLISFIGCQPKAVETGKSIKLNYTLTVDGTVIDTSIGKQPLEFVLGSGQIIPGLEEQLIGMKVGEKKQVTLAPEKGYGPIDPKATQNVDKKMFGDPKQLKVGMVVNGRNGDMPVRAKVLAIGAKDVTLDFNHPLAGKTLNFDVEIMGIEKAPPAPAMQMPAAPAQAPQ